MQPGWSNMQVAAILLAVSQSICAGVLLTVLQLMTEQLLMTGKHIAHAVIDDCGPAEANVSDAQGQQITSRTQRVRAVRQQHVLTSAAAGDDWRQKDPKDVRVLIVGSTGYIGKFVTRELVKRGYNTVALARERSGIKGKSGPEDVRKVWPVPKPAYICTLCRCHPRAVCDSFERTLHETPLRCA
jgi:NmrA-like family